eukprot:9001230-Pyramimonas_sp.AAC.1
MHAFAQGRQVHRPSLEEAAREHEGPAAGRGPKGPMVRSRHHGHRRAALRSHALRSQPGAERGWPDMFVQAARRSR